MMMMLMMMMLMMMMLMLVLVLVVLVLLVDKLHLDPPTARRHRLDRRPLPVADARVMVSTCMPGGSSEALSVIRGPQRHQRPSASCERPSAS